MTGPGCGVFYGDVQPPQVSIGMWLGKPGLMLPLRIARTLPDPLYGIGNLPDAGGWGNGATRAEVAHSLASGGTTVTRRRLAKRQFPLKLSAMTMDDADTILGLYTGEYGLGPFRLVDPSWRNALGFDASNFNIVPGAYPPAWANDIGSGSTITTIPALAGSPTPNCGVMQWTNPGTDEILFEGSQDTGGYPNYHANLLTAVPYIPGLPYTLSILCGSDADLGGSINAFGMNADGTWDGSSVVTGSSFVDLGSDGIPGGVAWVPVPAFSFPDTVAYICMGFASPGGTGSIFLTCPQTDIGWTSDFGGGGPRNWVSGLGCPRVSFAQGLGSSIGHVYWRRDHTLTLMEN